MIAVLLIIWLLLCVAFMCIGIGKTRFSAGLPLAYFLGLSLIHTPGAAVYLNFPGWDTLAAQTELGFQQTIIGMTAFLIGVSLARSVVFAAQPPQKPEPYRPEELATLDRLALIYLAGGMSYFALGSLASIPSFGAIISSFSLLLVVGASLRLWVAHQEKNAFKFWITVTLSPMLPLITILTGGFIGFGTYWLLSIVSFAFAQSKQRLGYFLIAPLVAFVGLSVFVNYMASRTAFREAAWFRQITVEEKLGRIMDMFRDFSWYDSENPKQREVIDGRLNQNLLVGMAVNRLSSAQVDYAHGSTLTGMAIGLIPRALWPDKPVVGGGGDVVTRFTGIKFPEGTSVGAGQVLEFYVNFGTLGVIGGFLIYGWLIGWMDIQVIDGLRRHDQKAFLLWFMVCLALLQPGGNLLEVAVTAAGSAATASVFGHFIANHLAKRRKRASLYAE